MLVSVESTDRFDNSLDMNSFVDVSSMRDETCIVPIETRESLVQTQRPCREHTHCSTQMLPWCIYLPYVCWMHVLTKALVWALSLLARCIIERLIDRFLSAAKFHLFCWISPKLECAANL